MNASVRDALQAYLQARIDGPGRPSTWAELPRAWWPASWFYAGDRNRPIWTRPVVRLVLALYGHPEAGYLWETFLTTTLEALGWRRIAEWPGVYIHTDFSIIIAYVDDLLLIADADKEAKHWSDIDKTIEFKTGPEPIGRYLGASYTFSPLIPASPDAVRSLRICMKDYALNAATRFFDELGSRPSKVSSPFVSDAEWATDKDQGGTFP